MDSITHILIGISVGRWVRPAKSPISPYAAGWIGALACTAPDFDMVLALAQEPLPLEAYHRGFTHSLTWLPWGAFWITLAILGSVSSWRQDWRSTWKPIYAIAFWSMATHGPLDSCTAYGTELWWPVIRDRISYDLIPIVDPVFTGIWLLGIIGQMVYPQIRHIGALTFCGALAYLGFCGWQHHRALDLQSQVIQDRQHHLTAQHARALPRLGSVYTWDTLYQTQGQVYLDTVSTPLGKPATLQHADGSMPLADPASPPAAIRQDPRGLQAWHTFTHFTQGYMATVPAAAATDTSPAPLHTLIDLRYILKSEAPQALWGATWTATPEGTLSIRRHERIALTGLETVPPPL